MTPKVKAILSAEIQATQKLISCFIHFYNYAYRKGQL